MTLAISLISGTLIFFSVYFSFTSLTQKVKNYFQSYVELTRAAYQDVFIIKDLQAVRRDLVMVAGIPALLIFFMSGPSAVGLVVGAVVFVYAWRLPYSYFNGPARQKRVNAFTGQMVDALTLMANALRSGLNMPQALQSVVDEMRGPVQQEFGLVLNENKLGVTFEQALENMARRLPSEDVKMFVTSVNILRETGGNIAETFDTITNTIRERIKLKNKIDAMTAQGRSSAMIVGGLPWGIGGVLYTLDPVAMTKLFVTPPGWAILGVVLLLEALGFVVISKIVAIKV